MMGYLAGSALALLTLLLAGCGQSVETALSLDVQRPDKNLTTEHTVKTGAAVDYQGYFSEPLVPGQSASLNIRLIPYYEQGSMQVWLQADDTLQLSGDLARVAELPASDPVEMAVQFVVPANSDAYITIFVEVQLPDGPTEMRVFSEKIPLRLETAELGGSSILKLENTPAETYLPAQETLR